MIRNSISTLFVWTATIGVAAGISCSKDKNNNNQPPANPGTGAETAASPPPAPSPTAAPSPIPMPPSPTPTLWGSLTLETQPDSEMPSCSQNREFTVMSNNRWQFEHCETESSGSLHHAERILIDQLARQTVDGGVDNRNCFHDPGTRIEMKLRYSNGQEVDLWEKESEQTCVRGRRGATEALLRYLQSLENKYALHPTPSPSPSPTITPTPTPSVSPTASPTPTITPTATPPEMPPEETPPETPTPTPTPVEVPPPPPQPEL